MATLIFISFDWQTFFFSVSLTADFQGFPLWQTHDKKKGAPALRIKTGNQEQKKKNIWFEMHKTFSQAFQCNCHVALREGELRKQELDINNDWCLSRKKKKYLKKICNDRTDFLFCD